MYKQVSRCFKTTASIHFCNGNNFYFKISKIRPQGSIKVYLSRSQIIILSVVVNTMEYDVIVSFIQKTPYWRVHTAMVCIFLCRSKFTSYVTRQFQQELTPQMQYAFLKCSTRTH